MGFKMRGFTLMELVIVMAIIAIIAGIAFPAYTSYVTQARRTDGQVTLLDLAARMDRFFTQNNTYVGATLANVGMPVVTPEGFYNMAITAQGATNYTIQAAPVGSQATDDTECATLTYNDLGAKGITGSGTVASCW